MAFKSNIRLILFIVFPVLFTACSGSDSEKSIYLKKGDYSYTLTDSTGRTLADGTIKITVISEDKTMTPATHRLNGSYTVKRYVDDNDTNFIGITTLRGGSLEGWWNNNSKTVNINLNPMIADANVYLSAEVNKSGNMKGSWIFSAFRNTRKGEGGFFNATRIK
ncbi:MAG: hypothetical protein N2510_07325 [Ignavibacteria bacterium]|nr:hypothetical protein [Ignavibacteria bacterium]